MLYKLLRSPTPISPSCRLPGAGSICEGAWGLATALWAAGSLKAFRLFFVPVVQSKGGVLLVYFEVVSPPTCLKLLAAHLHFNLRVLCAVCRLPICGTLLPSPLLEVVFFLAGAHSALLSARTLC